MAFGKDESGNPRVLKGRSHRAIRFTMTAIPICGRIIFSPILRLMSRIGAATGLREDQRWQYGIPPPRNANFAWVQHMVHHLSPTGTAGFVLANGSMSSSQSGEGEIRKNLIEAELIDCMVALPGQLFRSTQIPACLWFLARDRHNGKVPRPSEAKSSLLTLASWDIW